MDYPLYSLVFINHHYQHVHLDETDLFLPKKEGEIRVGEGGRYVISRKDKLQLQFLSQGLLYKLLRLIWFYLFFTASLVPLQHLLRLRASNKWPLPSSFIVGINILILIMLILIILIIIIINLIIITISLSLTSNLIRILVFFYRDHQKR